MGKGKEAAERVEDLTEEGRKFGFVAILAVLTIVGIAIWFIASQNGNN